jgi:hypothetical protein
MKIFYILLCILYSSQLLVANSGENKKTTKKSVEKNTNTVPVVKSDIKTTQPVTVKPIILPASNTNTPKPIGKTSESSISVGKGIEVPKECNACGDIDGTLIQKEENSLLNYDTVCKSYLKNIDVKELSGIWRYEKTYIFSNHNFFVEKVRNYFKDINDEPKFDSTKVFVEETPDEIFDRKNAEKKLRANKVGREEYALEDYILLLDPTVMYKFINKEGVENDYMAIIHFTPKNILQNLTMGEVQFRTNEVPAFNKTFLELTYSGSKVTKRYRILTLNKFSFIIADDINNEIHLFIR